MTLLQIYALYEEGKTAEFLAAVKDYGTFHFLRDIGVDHQDGVLKREEVEAMTATVKNGIAAQKPIGITDALRLAISALNQIPNSKFVCDDPKVTNTYKLLPALESSLAKHEKGLKSIASMYLWGERIGEADVKKEADEAHEYDNADDCYNPSADTESTMLREAVETVRIAIGLEPDREG